MAELILCWQQQSQHKMDSLAKKKRICLNMGHYWYWCKHKLAVVLKLTDLSPESFTFSEINSLPHCFLYCGMTFLLPHFQEQGKTSSQIFLLHWRWTVSSYFTDHFLQRCLVCWVHLQRKTLYTNIWQPRWQDLSREYHKLQDWGRCQR